MIRADVTQTVLEAYDSWWRGDAAGAAQCFHPEARISVAGDPATVPFAGEYHGEHGTAAFLARLDGISPPLTPTLGDLMVDGNSAVVRWTMPIRSGSTQAELQFIDLIRLRQGRIVALDQVFDTGAAARLLGAQPLPRPPRRAARRRNATSTRRPGPES